MARNKYKELGKNSTWTFLSNIGGKAIAFLMLPFYTSVLSVADYGVLDMMIGYSATFSEVVTLCIAQAIFVFPKGAEESDQKKYFTSGLCYAFLLAAALGGLAKIVTGLCVPPHNIFNDRFNYIYVMSVVSFLQAYMQNFIRSIGKMRVFGFIGIVYASFTAVYSFVLMPRWGLEGYVWATVSANATTTVYTFAAARLHRFFDLRCVEWEKCRRLLAYSSPLVVNTLILFMTHFLNRPFMEHYQSLENVGIYSVASKFPGIVVIMVPVFCLALQISVMEEFGKEGYWKFFNNILRLTTTILMGGSILLVPAGKYVIRMFAASEYAGAWIYMPALLLSSVFNYWGAFLGTNFTAAKKSKYFMYTGLLTVVVSVASDFLLIPGRGLWGVCFASLLTGLAFFLSRSVLCWQYVHISGIRNYAAQIALFVAVTVVCVYFDIDAMSLAAGVGAAAAILYMNRDLLPLLKRNMKRT